MSRIGKFIDILKMIKHKKPVPIFCPRCASPEIKLSSSLDYWLTPRKYICPKCGYTGILVMELEEDRDIQEKNSEISDKQKEATNKCI